MTRTETKAELDAKGVDTRQTAEKPPHSANAPAIRTAPARKPPQASPPAPRSASDLRGWLAASYALHWSGAGLNTESGPGLELGLALQRRLFVRGRLLFEHDFTASLRTGPIDARVSTDRFSALVDFGTMLGRTSALGVSLGAGQDRSLIEPTGSHDASVLPAPASLRSPVVAQAALRVEVGASDFWLALAAGATVPLVRTPYNVDPGANGKQLGEPWAVQPSTTVSLGWQPRLATF